MNHQSLPGIQAIGYVPAENLQREIMYKHLAGLPVGIFTEVTPIAFVGVPTCEAVSTYNNNGRVEQATLRFKTLDDVPTNRHIAFVVTDCNGQSYVIGQHEKPRPIIKEARAPQERLAAILRYRSFEVTLYAQKSLIPCIRS